MPYLVQLHAYPSVFYEHLVFIGGLIWCIRQISLIPRPFALPVFARLQYEIQWGKAWEIWSRAVPSGRQMVDTQRAVPNEES